MHHIYHTEAIIIYHGNIGEANRLFTIFTRDLGMIRATAQSVRLGKSKLRPSLQDYNLISLDVVQGKGGIWRIVNARKKDTLESLTTNKKKYSAWIKTLYLLRELYHGEDPHPELFDDLVSEYTHFSQPVFAENFIDLFETIMAFRVVSALGYGETHETLTPALYGPVDLPLLISLSKEKKLIISSVNNALREAAV